jgi:tripeptide aminopeptidase
MKVQDRFLQYVSYWTTSDEEGQGNPTSEREWALARVLEAELRDLGLVQVRLSDQCYVYGLLPATPGMEHAKAIGFIAHMDTAPDFSGEQVKPQIIENYDGGDVLLSGSGTYLKVSEFPDLAQRAGQTLITTDGTTLLGADDKAGVAEIFTMVETLRASGLPHGDIWVGITPDEEVGIGSKSFDLDYFKADYAYTVDGAYEGEIAFENFNAASADFRIRGVSVHPGEAKNIMVNAALIGCELAMALPQTETPAHTEGREGFYHLTDMTGDVTSATLSYIVRDHDKAVFEQRLDTLRKLAESMNARYGAGTVTLTITPSYENMISVLKDRMYIVELAKEAIQKCGVTPESMPIRGGTDGARLSFLGLPCPNLGTGGFGFHGPYEHITVEAMEKVVEILMSIATNPVME